MDLAAQRRQRNHWDRKQRRLNRLLRQMARLRKRANENDVYEELVARSIAQMFTRSLTMQALTNRMILTTSAPDLPSSENDTPDNMCHDIRGRDRACCNTALTCFDDVANVIDDLEKSPNDYTLLTACRKVSEELKRDKVCIKQGLSSCGGTGKAVLQRRFDIRINNLYDQFYKHCRGRTVAPTTTTTNSTTHLPEVANQTTQRPVPTTRITTSISPVAPGTYTHSPTENTQQNGNGVGIDSGAIIVGAVTGGAILIVMIIIAIVLWCRNRKHRYDSDSSGGSAGVFFKKRPNARPHGNNNNTKPPATRQDSTVYAEIDERFVNSGFKPPLPSDMTNAGYLHPIGDENDSDHYNQPNNISGNVPMATTRGQLSYGPILAANSDSATDNSLFYYSTTLHPPADRPQSGRELPRIPQNGNDDNVSSSLFRAKPGVRQDNFYVECHADSNDDLDEYEEPVSTQNSVKYSHVETETSPPYEPAPGIPTEQKTPENKHKMAVKVLPSNPFISAAEPSSKKSSSDPNTPTAKPRRKKESNADKPEPNKADSMEINLEKFKLSNRDSNVSDSSTKSSHHYFVLEPETTAEAHDELGYENSVSSSKLV